MDRNIKRRKTFLIIYLVITLAIMTFIFVQSSLPDEQSSEQSQGFEDVLTEILEDGVNVQTDPDIIDKIVRKSAHMFEFFVFSVFVSLSLAEYLSIYKGLHLNNKKILAKVLFIAGCIAIFYATSDEFHQLFVPGRVGSIVDIIVDSVGVIVGANVMRLVLSKVYRKIILADSGKQ